MSNHAYLVSNDNPTPAGRDDTGHLNYDSKGMVSEGGGYIFPLLWLSAFRPEDIVQHTTENYTIPCPVVSRVTAIGNLASARDFICSEFANVAPHWPNWEAMVHSSSGQYLKIDGIEIWDGDPDLYVDAMPEALRWFVSRQDNDREKLLALCTLDFDPTSRLLSLNGDPVTGDNLYGLALK